MGAIMDEKNAEGRRQARAISDPRFYDKPHGWPWPASLTCNNGQRLRRPPSRIKRLLDWLKPFPPCQDCKAAEKGYCESCYYEANGL